MDNKSFYNKYNEQQESLSKFCYNKLMSFLKENSNKFNVKFEDIVSFMKKATWNRLFGAHRILWWYLTPWIAEVFDICDENIIYQISYASFLGRFWFILRDYRLDEPDLIKEIIQLEKWMKKEVYKNYIALIPYSKRKKFTKYFNDLYKISNEWNQKDIMKRKKQIVEYGNEDIKAIGNKIAIVNRTTCALWLISKKDNEIISIVNGIQKILTITQINHDLTDFEEDRKIKNFTLPMTLAIQAEIGKLPISISKINKLYDQIKSNFYSKNVLSSGLKIMNELSKEALTCFKKPRKNPFHFHVKEIIKRNEFLKKKLINSSEPLNIWFIQEVLKKNQWHPNLHNIIFYQGDQL